MTEETMQAGETLSLLAPGNGLQLSIDVLAVLVGIISIIVILQTNRQLGGRVSQALRYFILGVFSNVLAILSSIFYGHDIMLGGLHFDLHQNLMTLGMVFFIISTTRFSKLVQNV